MDKKSFLERFFIFDVTDDAGLACIHGRRGFETYDDAKEQVRFEIQNSRAHRRLAIFERRETFFLPRGNIASDGHNPIR